MRLLDDERGQSVQVGAAILLGFVVIAITLYQVEIVSSQNAEVEFNHDQEIRDQLTELRNSINNAGTQGEGDSVSVKLGGQYPPRTIFVNPPPIQGALQSQQAGNISFGNVQVQGSYGGSGDPTELVSGNHTTNRLVYVPRYFELDDAGVTSIEHSLAFKAFENNATDPLTRQRVVRGDSLTLTVLRGNVSEQGTQSISLDPETVSGPTDPISIEPANSSEPIEVYLPTETPSIWNESIGTEFGYNDARVAGYDGSRVLIELDRNQYQLQIALVEIGDGVNETGRYEVLDQTNGGSNAGASRYSLSWQDPTGAPGTEEPCDANSCLWNVTADTDSQLDLIAETNPSLDGVSIDFAVDNSSIATVSGDGETQDGVQTATLNAKDVNGTVSVYATSDGGSDVIDVRVRQPGGGGSGTTINARADDITNVRDDEPRFYVSYDVDGTYDEVEVIAQSTESSASDQTVSTEARNGATLEPGWGVGERFEITVRALEGGTPVAEKTLTTPANATNPTENDDLSLGTSPQFVTQDIEDRSNTQTNRVQYRFNYEVSNTGQFNQAELLVLNQNGNGASGTATSTDPNPNNVDVEPGDGTGTWYKVGILVMDTDGVVVEYRLVEDQANGNGP